MINPNNPDFNNTPAHPSRKYIEQRLIAWDDTPVMTILTPFYNTGSVFHETARSVLNQTLQQWEWLIINDGSTDPEPLQILETFRKADPRIRVIDHPENRGLSAARNTGFDNARCEYVLLVDSDDLLEPTAAEKWWWFLETHPQYGFVASYHVVFSGINFLWTGGFHDGAMNAERNRVSMMCAARKSVHQSVGGFDESIRGGLEDWDFWMRCADRGYWGATIPEYLAWYRVRGEHSDRWENLQESRLREFRTILKDKYPRLYEGGFPSLIETVDYDLTTMNTELPTINRLQKNNPHLLIILPWLVMGGAERFTLNLIDQLVGKGWTISILTTAQSDNPWLYEFEKRTPFVFILPNTIPIKDYPRFIGYLIQSRDFDAVLIQGSHEGYRLLPALRAMAPNLPIVDFLHFVTPDWMQGGFPRLSALYRDLLDHSFTSCEQVRQWMIDAGANADRTSVCYIGADAQAWKPDFSLRMQVRADLGIRPDDTVFLYAARLEEQKQPEVFADTLKKLAEKGDNFHAIIAGEGSLQTRLDDQLYASGLMKQVHMLGSVPPEKMPAIMAASDIFFLPSKNEGISQALYEAMACGLVVVSSKVGGQGELVTPDCGILISPLEGQDEADEYAQILHGLICDPHRRQKMSQASRQRVIENFTLTQAGSCIHDSLCAIIENKKRNPMHTDPVVEKEAIERETRTVVEYVQARQRLRWLEPEYQALIQPKTASHWFYLWVRQVLLPVYNWIARTGLSKWIVNLKRSVKHRLVKEP